MIIPRYWARSASQTVTTDERTYAFSCWGWSDESQAEARNKADLRATQAAQKLSGGAQPGLYPGQEYDRAPIREEVIERITNDAGDQVAVLTRNSHGALVLNAAQVMFIDIDFADDKAPAAGLLGLFRKPAISREQRMLGAIEQWANARSDYTLRVYRTAAGYRCVVLNRLMQAGSERATQILTELNSDRLYIRLCQTQQCFRARLTPKPFRIDLRAIQPRHMPAEDDLPGQAQRAAWVAEYEQRARKFATCTIAGQFGAMLPDPEVMRILEIHDRHTQVSAGLPLA